MRDLYPKFQRIWDLEKTPSLHGGNIRRVIFFPTGSPRLHGTAISAPLCGPSYISKSLCQLYMITFIKSNWLLVCKVDQNITRPRDQPPFFDGILHTAGAGLFWWGKMLRQVVWILPTHILPFQTVGSHDFGKILTFCSQFCFPAK